MPHAHSRRAIARVNAPTWLCAASLALAGAAATLAWAPAVAAAPRQAGYSVALTSPLAAPRRQIVNGIMWRCEGDACSGGADGSRPVVACQRVVEAFGPVARFTGPKGELSAEDLARCNAR